VATIVETGIVGAVLFGVFVVWLFRRLGAARRIGRALSAARDPLAARVRPVAWGMTAALVATLVANFFYLTMSFYYFYVFATLAAALPVVAARARRG
jgi:O-antigen ligase